jgi:DnaK suppressor protein
LNTRSAHVTGVHAAQCDMDVDAVQHTLEVERVATLARIESVQTDLADIMSAGQQNGDDEHDPEGATVAFERARTISLLNEARNRLGDLEQAAQRMTSGTYELCEHCHQPIGPERLAARPDVRTCIGCAGRST